MSQFEEYEISSIYSNYDRLHLANTYLEIMPENICNSINLLRYIRIQLNNLNIFHSEFTLSNFEHLLITDLKINKEHSKSICEELSCTTFGSKLITAQTLEDIESVIIGNFILKKLEQSN